MTVCPCYECERRYIACHASCKKYAKWLVIHEEEKDRERKKRANAHDVDKFLYEQNKRVQQARHREYMRERKGE